jgi:hypothetical protein
VFDEKTGHEKSRDTVPLRHIADFTYLIHSKKNSQQGRKIQYQCGNSWFKACFRHPGSTKAGVTSAMDASSMQSAGVLAGPHPGPGSCCQRSVPTEFMYSNDSKILSLLGALKL